MLKHAWKPASSTQSKLNVQSATPTVYRLLGQAKASHSHPINGKGKWAERL